MKNNPNRILSRRTVSPIAVLAVAASLPSVASASVVSYTNADAWWAASATPVTSIFFTEIDFAPSGPTVVNDQYAALGVHFADHYLADSFELYPSDGRGLAASLNLIGQITVDFTTARTSVAAEHISSMRLELYADDVFVGTSIMSGISGTGFIGVVSETPFNRVVILNPDSSIPRLDNLHFGAPIPAPAGIAVLLALGLGGRRRRTN